MSQADDFQQYAGRLIDGPIDSNKTTYRPLARSPQGRIISQLNCRVLGTIYLNMFCRIDYLPCALAPV
jgi:hypothetical protein